MYLGSIQEVFRKYLGSNKRSVYLRRYIIGPFYPPKLNFVPRVTMMSVNW